MKIELSEEASHLVSVLGLSPHPEGGFYREIFRAPLKLSGLPHGGDRDASTAIYFLLPAGAFSALHRVRESDEIWHHYFGDPVELHLLSPDGGYRVEVLGSAIALGQRPVVVVPAGFWQAAIPRGERFALCGCTVAPGFDFSDFDMPPRAELLARFPGQEAVIHRLTR